MERSTPQLPIKKRILALLNVPLDYSMRNLTNSSRSSNSSSSSSNSSSSSTISPIQQADRPRAPYKCPECSHSFKIYERLKAHLRRHKIKESGRYTCTTCRKTFVQQSSLITHKRIHSGERPYQCEICFRGYGDLSTFTKHKRTHSGEKPYQCLFCHRRFTQSGNCLRHTRSVHNKLKHN